MNFAGSHFLTSHSHPAALANCADGQAHKEERTLPLVFVESGLWTWRKMRRSENGTISVVLRTEYVYKGTSENWD